MKTHAMHRDFFAEIKPGFAELVERRLGKNRDRWLSVADVASVLDLGRTKVLEMIEGGIIKATNLNRGREVLIDPERPSRGRRPMMPLWRITYDAIIAMAHSMEEGV